MTLPAKADAVKPDTLPAEPMVRTLRDRLAQELTPAAVRPVPSPEITATIVSTAARRFGFYMTGLIALALLFLFARSPTAIAAAVAFTCALFAWAQMFEGRQS